MRGKYELDVYKNNDEWTCITDVGMKYLKWIVIGILLISLIWRHFCAVFNHTAF